MTEQEKIRKELGEIELGVFDLCGFLEGHTHLTPEGREKIIACLNSQGVVLKVERELPHNPYPNRLHLSKDNKYIAYRRAQQDILKAGYTAVEPLI